MPFWEMHTGAWMTTRDLADNKYEVRTAFANFYAPPRSTELLESFNSLFTGKTLPVTHPAPKVMLSVHSLDGGSAFGGTNPPGMKVTRRFTPNLSTRPNH